jgi:drug/metabolite transporter (DMT)-like permease
VKHSHESTSTLLPVLAVIASMAIWGLSFVSSKAILNTGFPPMTMVLLRFLIASAVLLPVQRRLQPRFRFPRQGRLLLVLSAFFGTCLYFFFESRGIKYTSASNAALITATIPALTVAAEYFLFRRAVRWYQGLGILLSIVGVYFIVQHSHGQYDRPLLGNILMIGACLSWLTFNMVSRNLHEQFPGLSLTTYQAAVGVMFLLPFALSEVRYWTLPGPAVWLNLLYLGLVCSAGGYFFYLFALSRLGPVAVTSYINLLPLVGAVGGVLLLGERLLAAQVIGGVVVIAGVFLVNLRFAAAQRGTREPPSMQAEGPR